MDKQLASYFFEQASTAFAFLVSEHGFAVPQLRIDESIQFAFVSFKGRNVAVECILDERESDVECKIAHVVDGRITRCYDYDERGVRVRDGIASILQRRGVRDRLFERVGDLGLKDRIRVTLSDYARMLRKHGGDILADSPGALL